MSKPQVVKLAQPGIDVKTAGDEHLVYNSNWPLLKIYNQGFFADSSGIDQRFISHDLGYTPAFWYFSNNSLLDWRTPFVGAVENRSEFNGACQTFITADNYGLRIAGYPPVGTVRFYWYILALDITVAYSAPQIKSGGVIGPRNTKTVFKLAKTGKDISSSRLEDYTVHSQARSPMIHAVVPFKLGFNQTFTYNHGLGYVPMLFAYAKCGTGIGGTADAGKYIILPINGGVGGFNTDSQNITFNSTFSGTNEFSLVVLKDPFNIDGTIAVTI